MGRKTKGRYRLPRIEGNKFRCPRCGATINWSAPGGVGSKGYAHCSRSLNATQVWKKDSAPPDFCTWNGEVLRLTNFKIEIWGDLEWTVYPHS